MADTMIIAYLGKGGTGKTILSALTGKMFIEEGKRVLYIDADPAMGLATALAAEGYKTIGKAREEIIFKAKSLKKESSDDISEIIEYLILEALYETRDYSMFVMGYTNTIGCFCPVNNLLRDTIKAVSEKFDVVIIDAEAGIEQINRQVTDSVHYPILITDNSLRGVRTTVLAYETIRNSPNMKNPVKLGVIFNRVDNADSELLEIISDNHLNYYGCIPSDPAISEFDKKGLSALGIPHNAVSYQTLKQILSKIAE